MADMTNRLAIIFRHPKSTEDGVDPNDEEQPMMVGVTIPWLLANGIPQTQKGKPWIFISTETIQ